MANKDLYNVFGSNRNSGAGQMMKKRTPRPTENTHEHTSGSFGGQNMVNQLEKSDRLKQLGDAARSVGRMVIGAVPGMMTESVAKKLTKKPLNGVSGRSGKTAAGQIIPRDLEASEARTDMIGVKKSTPRTGGQTTGRGQITYSGYNAPTNNQKKRSGGATR